MEIIEAIELISFYVICEPIFSFTNNILERFLYLSQASLLKLTKFISIVIKFAQLLDQIYFVKLVFGSDRSPRCQDIVCLSVCACITLFIKGSESFLKGAQKYSSRAQELKRGVKREHTEST